MMPLKNFGIRIPNPEEFYRDLLLRAKASHREMMARREDESVFVILEKVVDAVRTGKLALLIDLDLCGKCVLVDSDDLSDTDRIFCNVQAEVVKQLKAVGWEASWQERTSGYLREKSLWLSLSNEEAKETWTYRKKR
jgi:hypothetical protein